MKNVHFIAIAFLCAVAPLSAQDVHSVFGNRAANTPQDLLRMLPVSPYTWDAGSDKGQIKFNADGTGKQSFFEFTWTVQDAQRVEIVANDTNKKTVLTFDANYASYSGLDFDGHQLSGRIVAPPKPAATPKPAAATPPPTVAGAPGSSTQPPAAGVTVATPTPAQASGTFFQNLQTSTGNFDSTTASAGELAGALAGREYTFDFGGWSGATIKFNADGTASSNIKYLKKLSWKVRSAHEIEVFLTGKKGEGKYLLRFSNDLAKYSGTDPDDGEFAGHANN